MSQAIQPPQPDQSSPITPQTIAQADTPAPKGSELLKQSATDPAGRGSSARILAFGCAILAAYMTLRGYDINAWKEWLNGSVWLIAYAQASKAGEGAIRAAFEAWQSKQSKSFPTPTPQASTPSPQPEKGKK